ncbi:MAG: glycosyltransferase family 2 protein [Acidimicrobiales bacterium]|jgi:glycosyltransferase involved in cell wall biosynthesis
MSPSTNAVPDGVEGTTRPTVSVCLPVSRSSAFTTRALDSIVGQQLDDLEVLVGDETGESGAAVDAVADRRVDYRRNPCRLGYSENHVALLDRARGHYLAVLHDDDWWEPSYLSSLTAVLDADPAVGVVCCDVSRDVEGGTEPEGEWPIPLVPGRNEDVLEVLLREEWFLLPSATVFRHEVWDGAAREWQRDLHTSELQLYLSAAEAGWAFYYLPEPLVHWLQHGGQSSVHRGGDFGLAMADDVLEFWARWLSFRPAGLTEASSRQRAKAQLRRARALILLAQRAAAREALAEAATLAGPDLPDLRRLAFAARVPGPLLRVGLGAKRAAQRTTHTLLDRSRR